GALVRHTPLDALRDELLKLLGRVLEVAVRRAVPAGHRAQRAHAAVGLVGAALVELDVARRFFGAGEEAADHRRMRARDDRLRDVPGVADAAVRDDRHVRALERGCDLRDGRDLRHADPRDDPRRADRARADADLDPVRARLDEGARRLPRHDVAGDELEVRVRALDLADPVQHALRVAVRRVDDHDVDARLDEPRDALLGVVARADGRADAQRAVL